MILYFRFTGTVPAVSRHRVSPTLRAFKCVLRILMSNGIEFHGIIYDGVRLKIMEIDYDILGTVIVILK